MARKTHSNRMYNPVREKADLVRRLMQTLKLMGWQVQDDKSLFNPATGQTVTRKTEVVELKRLVEQGMEKARNRES